jgi:hypothetical protein
MRSALRASLALSLLVLVVAAPASARTQAASCSLVSPAVLHHVLGVTVGSLTTQSGHGHLSCSYSVNGVPDVVKVSFDTGVSLAMFTATKNSFAHAYQHVHAVHGLGDSAFAGSQGTGAFGSTLLFVHKGHSQLGVTANASLAKCEQLARMLLPHV